MSWMISSAICCFTMTASMSGVALGYNYSLAEYIELKETNVSVYLKRGVFDDEVVDEMDWRRSGGGGAAPESQEQAPEPYSSGRRSNVEERRESIFDGTSETPIPISTMFNDDEHHQFEGSLMKLTAKPKSGDAIFVNKPVPIGFPQPMSDSIDFENRRKMDYPSANIKKASEPKSGDWNQELQSIQKALQEKQLAARKYATLRPTKVMELHPTKPHLPGEYEPPYPPPTPPSNGRRMMEGETTAENDIMLLVRQQENEKPPPKWYEPRPPKEYTHVLTLVPITTRPRPLTPKHVHTTTKANEGVILRRFQGNDFVSKIGSETDIDGAIKDRDYSDDEIKGLPIRKKRSIKSNTGIDKRQILDSNVNDKVDKLSNNRSLDKKEKNYLQKIIDAIENINNMLSFTQRKTNKSTLDMDCTTKLDVMGAFNFGPSPGTLILKIMKSTAAS